MNLYIIRHAIAVDRVAPEYESDRERPLTDTGRTKMRQIARALRSIGVELDLILSSPYVRACETAEILREVFRLKKEVVLSDNLVPLGDAELLIGEIKEKYSTNNMAVVGHEPYLSTLISWLVADNAKIDITLKKGGACYLTADDLHDFDHRATLEWLLTPGILMEIGDR